VSPAALSGLIWSMVLVSYKPGSTTTQPQNCSAFDPSRFVPDGVVYQFERAGLFGLFLF